MTHQGVCLAAIEGLGQVHDCGACGNIHVQIGPISLTLEPSAYMQVVAMLSTSASNFELWLQRRNSAPFAQKPFAQKSDPFDEPKRVSVEQNPNEQGTS